MILLTAGLLLAPAAARAGEKSPVERLKDDNAEVEAAAARELVAGDEKFLPEIEKAYKALKEGDRKLRERYRDVVARIRTAQIRKWALKDAPGLAKKFQWDGLVRYLTWTARLATREDARRAFCLITRSAEGWSEAEGVKLLGQCLAEESVAVRRAAVSALDRPKWKKGGVDLLVSALKDKAEIVRVEAGSCLVGRGDQRGLAAVMAGALSKDKEVREACVGTVSGLIAMEPGKPHRPRFKHTREEVAVIIRLLELEPWNTRGTVIRLLGMIGDKSAAKPLLDQLAKEGNPKNRNRLCTSLAQLGHRPAAAEIPKYFGAKLSASKKNYNWSAAAAWGEIGDPEAVPAVIALLDSEDRLLPLYAAYALSWAFAGRAVMGDPPLRGRPAVLLVPGAAGKLDQKNFADAPKGAELKKLWAGFWAGNKARYKWAPGRHALRPAAKSKEK